MLILMKLEAVGCDITFVSVKWGNKGQIEEEKNGGQKTSVPPDNL